MVLPTRVQAREILDFNTPAKAPVEEQGKEATPQLKWVFTQEQCQGLLASAVLWSPSQVWLSLPPRRAFTIAVW